MRQTSSSPSTRVAMIITRSLDDEPYLSRVRTLREIHTAIDSAFGADVYRLHNILETKKPRDLLCAAWIFLINVLKFSPLPLQCIFYAARSDIKKLTSAIGENGYEKIYLDTVRCVVLLRAIRRLPDSHGNRRITVDFDDLFSRRMRTVATSKMPLSLGFAQKYFPAILRRTIEGPLSRLINRHEAATLPRVEYEIANTVNSIILVSETERRLFAERLCRRASASIHAIPPPARPQTDAPGVRPPIRFVFIGSDRQIHNRLSIDFLLNMWRTIQPATSLHIYGTQQTTPSVHNVIWHGFVAQISDVYSENSILILPALLSGGVKTKVIEAWAHGRPVLGNHAAFEGVQISEYPLQLPETAWTPLVTAPWEHLETFQRAAHLGLQFINTNLSPARYQSLWCTAITQPTATPALHRTASEDEGLNSVDRPRLRNLQPPTPP